MERRPLIAGNWKMYKTAGEAADTARELIHEIEGADDVEIVVFPPFTALPAVAEVVANTRIFMGAQNIHWETEGAFTGEISAGMVRFAGCRYVLSGHSERRRYFGETDETVNRRVKAALSEKLIPVVCVGETESERESNKIKYVLDKQIRKGLQGVFPDGPEGLVIAYEPVWAIGTGKTATPEMVREAHGMIREILKEIMGDTATGIRIIYGGSVKPDNIKDLMAMSDVDGALVGGAGLDAKTFGKIVCYRKAD